MKLTCNDCKKSKCCTEFNKHKSRKTGFQQKCKDCQKKYKDLHYQKNKKRYYEESKKHKIKRKIIFFKWLKTQSCIDCGEDDFRVLEFDHRNPEEKSFSISSKIHCMTFENLKKEIDKCDCVCANCHRKRTAEQFNWYKYLE